MSSNRGRISSFINEIRGSSPIEEMAKRLSPKSAAQPRARLPRGKSNEEVKKRLAMIPISEGAEKEIADEKSLERAGCYSSNIDNYIGTVKIPLGVAGPLCVNGLFATGTYFVPMATTEAALVASYSRGAQLITAAGGCSAMLLNEGISRSPGLIFENIIEAGSFVVWANEHFEKFQELAAATSRHGRLIDMAVTIEGNHVYCNLEFTTGDASGQNMVTIAAQHICDFIREQCPVRAKKIFVEANLSGDKKASFQSFQTVRGKKVCAEIRIDPLLIKKYLHTTPSDLADYWRISAIGGSLSGTIGMQGHYANGLAALYLATGQDVACVAESSIGTTRLERAENGWLYASVNLPNLMVGTVGGGTGLPSQKACLEMLSLYGPGKVRALAEVCAALCLAGELSIMGALCAGDFTKAHRLLARGR